MIAFFGGAGPEMSRKADVSAVEMVDPVIVQGDLVFFAVD
jgi:hypothetical protein